MPEERDEPALRVVGGRALSGAVEVGGAKNAAMPCLAAALLGDQPSLIERAPDIADVRGFCEMLRALGADVAHDRERGSIAVAPPDSPANAAPDHLVQRQRASFLLVGALLARGLPCVESAPPGGDAIGERSLAIQVKGFRALGADIEELDEGRIIARAPRRLRGARLFLDFPSVLSTENLLLAAVLAKGETKLINAAQEPEIVCLAKRLKKMGALISGAGSAVITINGVEQLDGAKGSLIPDRIEAGTLAIAAAISRGSATLRGVRKRDLIGVRDKLNEIGVSLENTRGGLAVRATAPLRAANIQTMPYPGFPTDLQAPITALLTQAEGESEILERVFENRMQHIKELRCMGAKVAAADKSRVELWGPSPLSGRTVRGGDIRAVAALVLAALAAAGESHIYGVDHLDRGYARLEDKLAALGADIARVP